MSDLIGRLRDRSWQDGRVMIRAELDVWDGTCHEAADELERLQAYKDDIENSTKFAMDEECTLDEKHCTCVPLLRAEIERLQRASVILDERDRQDKKWGPQNHTLPEWVTILMEEVGELAAAVLCHRFGNDDHPELDWRKEAIQVAAVALSMTEQYREAAEKGEDDGD